MKNNNNIIVSICSLTYNHASYIRQCLDSFLMQQTNFAFEVIINDDCSTDGTTEILQEYEKKYPDIIKPIYHIENQYSKGIDVMSFVYEKASGKYLAICEGDDYWIDSCKLQKQVDFLEKHKEYTMCCSNARIITEQGELDWTRYTNNRTIPTKDIILGGGLFVATASLIYHKTLLDSYPQYARQCHVGDYPIQIYAALKGKVYWFSEKQVTYRFQTDNSWTKKTKTLPFEKLLNGWESETNMLKGMNQYSNGKYSTYFEQRINHYIYTKFLEHIDFFTQLKKEFSDIYSKFSVKQKITIYLLKNKLYLLNRIFNKICNIIKHYHT